MGLVLILVEHHSEQVAIQIMILPFLLFEFNFLTSLKAILKFYHLNHKWHLIKCLSKS